MKHLKTFLVMFAIFGLSMNCALAQPHPAMGSGLFGFISGAAIENLGVENCNVKGGGEGNVGGLAGYAEETTIANCYTTGEVSVNASTSTGLGGLVGSHNGPNRFIPTPQTGNYKLQIANYELRM